MIVAGCIQLTLKTSLNPPKPAATQFGRVDPFYGICLGLLGRYRYLLLCDKLCTHKLSIGKRLAVERYSAAKKQSGTRGDIQCSRCKTNLMDKPLVVIN